MKRLAIVGFLLLIAAAGVYLGIINPKKVKAQARGALYDARRAAGELTEGPAGPSLSAVQSAAACRQNLQRIESAKRAIASRQGTAAGSVSLDAIKRELGGTMPRCPAGGAYSINSLEMLPTCTISGAGSLTSDDDHSIKRY